MPTPDANIFCAGHSHVVASDSSLLLVTGGTEDGTENGTTHNRIFNVAANNWRVAPEMRQKRWYSTVTTLRGGDQAIVTSGSRYIHAHTFGGSKSGAAPADSILRIGIAGSGEWDPSVGKPPGAGPGDWPKPREGHTAVLNSLHLPEFYIGGKLDDGQFTNEIWTLGRGNGPQTPDYVYHWLPISPTDQNVPDKRAEHTTVLLEDGSMVVFGGRGRTPVGQDIFFGDAWRLWFNPQTPLTPWHWKQVFIPDTPPQPSPRFSHAAVYDGARRRMILFGGAGPTQIASDDTVWALNFSANPDTATWSALPVAGSQRPAARYDHTLDWDSDPSVRAGQASRRAILFGGKGQFGAETLSNELWILWINDASGALEWEPVTATGNGPARRSGHSTWYLPGSAKRLFVLGGETAAGKVGDLHFVTLKPESAAAWNTYQSALTATTNQTSVLFGSAPVISRTPEVLTMGSSAWSPREAAYLWQEYYPQVFVAQGGRIFSPGPSQDSWRLDPYDSLASWERYPASSSSGFVGGSAVMYRPGRVMKCGSRDAEGQTNAATGTTKSINLNDASPVWTASDTMLGRVNHNLVILPTGQVLVVGGTRVKDQNANAIYQPEIWDPTWNNWAGTWYGRSGTVTLQPDTMIRDYHSTALLLPTAQVLCAGGNGALAHRTKANIYCPPYLFASNGTPLARPRIDCAPKRVTYGECFQICTPQAATIQSACLIRPGAATHGFDQDQRYVPLTSTPATSPARLLLNAPASQDDAPAGDYLLFIVDGAGGNSVPAVGRWIRLVTTPSACDNTPPDAVTDFSPDLVSPTSIYLSWTAPGDDGSNGTAAVYDVRRSPSQITNESNFATAALVDSEPPPQPAGTPELFGVSPLVPCTKYYFALRTLDEVCNPAALGSLPIWAKTLCVGGGGGGASARLARDEGEAGGGVRGRVAGAAGAGPEEGSNLAAAGSPSGGMIVETERAGDGGWQIKVRAVPATEPSTPEDERLAIEERDAAGRWRPRGSMVADPSAGELGLCALRERGRILLPGDFGVRQVAGAFRRGPTRYALTAAVHSLLGGLDTALLNQGGDLKLAPGDDVTLSYEPSTTEPANGESDDEGWYLIVGRSPLPGATMSTKAPRGSGTVPERFALYESQPNPFRARATIRFDLPVGAMVRLEVFDLQGRRLTVLADRYFVPGHHTVDWDKSTREGSRAGPGVYFCRIQAGPFRDRKTMVLLP